MKYEIVSQQVVPDQFIPEIIVRKHLRLYDETESDVIAYYMKAAISMVESRLSMIFRSNQEETVVSFGTSQFEIKLRGLVMFNNILEAKYYSTDGTYKSIPSYTFQNVSYPYVIHIDEIPSDLEMSGDQTFKFTMSGGALPSQAPNQALEAILLLVGHYYNQREAEHIGGVTTMVKEGVDRLLASAKKY